MFVIIQGHLEKGNEDKNKKGNEDEIYNPLFGANGK